MRDDETVVIPADRLTDYCTRVLMGLGVPDDQAGVVAGSLVEADLRGVDSHGVHLMALYAERLRGGHLRGRTEVTVLRDEGASALLDGGQGLGQISGLAAVDLAVAKACEYGVGTVAVRNSSHLGALGWYTMRGAAAGCVTLAAQNGPPFVPPFGGVTGIFSTNPMSYAVPAGEEPMLVLDMATTAVAGNRVLLAQKRGDPELPSGWANDDRGRPTTDPAQASVRHLQWFGGYKGYGIALLIEILAGVLTGASFGLVDREPGALTGFDRVTRGFVFVALDPAHFGPVDVFRADVDRLIRDIHASEPADGVEQVLVPGELEHRRRAERLVHGIPLAPALVAELATLGRTTAAGPFPPDPPTMRI
ncbi:MAG: Ldh family oxidoreductase [Actinomycetota bacterium]